MGTAKIKKSTVRVAHLWAAGIVASIVILFTGVVAYTSVDAQSRLKEETVTTLFRQILGRFDRLEKRLDRIEQMLKTNSSGAPSSRTSPATTPPQNVNPKATPDERRPTGECREACQKENEGNVNAINRCFVARCTEARPAAPQATREQCIEKCKEIVQGTDQGPNGKELYDQKLDACVKINC